MPLFSTTLSSAGIPGASTVANLNWMGGKAVTIAVYPSTAAAMSGDFTIQYTLDDVMRTASSQVLWAAISSNPFNQVDTTPSAGFHWTSSALPVPDGLVITWPNPICAVRLYSTALSSGTLTLKVVQGEGW